MSTRGGFGGGGAGSGFSGAYGDLTGKPTLGTVAALAVDTDTALAADSDVKVPSQKAVKAYAVPISSYIVIPGSLEAAGGFVTNPGGVGKTFYGSHSMASIGEGAFSYADYVASALTYVINVGVAGTTTALTIASDAAATFASGVTASSFSGAGTGLSGTAASLTAGAATLAAQATILAAGRTIAITGDLAYTSPSFNGSGNVTAAGTLATVNSNVGSFGSATTSLTVTVNGKGLVTAMSSQTVTPAVGSITGLGTGVATALAVNVGTAGSFNPMTTGGDVIYGGASGVATRLANGSAGQYLQSNGTTVAPSWVTPAAVNLLTDTWNSSGTRFYGINIAVTDTASAATSKLLALYGGAAGTTEYFSVSKAGLFHTTAPFALQFPDSGTGGGNARGTNAIDLQYVRAAATQVASGTRAGVFGSSNTASATDSHAIGQGNTAGGGSLNLACGIGNEAANGTNANNVAVFGVQGRVGTANGAANSVVLSGYRATSSGTNCVAIGMQCDDRGVSGTHVASNGVFASVGDSQTGVYRVRKITTDATAAVVLTADAGTASAVNQCQLPNNSVYTFDILVTARRTDSADYGSWRIVGCIRRNANAAATAIVGSPTVTTIAAPGGAWTAPAVAADTTNGALQVNVAGAVSETVRWLAVITTAQVTN